MILETQKKLNALASVFLSRVIALILGLDSE